ncbi:MAG: hypothetical protein MJ211_15655 [Bacteroidales bacterium]|nr:hypothetical protein [Bacteroidales bacterium]
MKKLFKTLMGTFLLVAGLFPIFCAKNNANPTYAEEGDRVTDVISVDTMKAEGINLNSWSLKTINSKPENNFDCDYKINTQLGATKISTLEEKEKNLCFKLETGSFFSNAVGLMSTKLIGFVRSVSIEFGDYSIITNDFLTVDLYGSNNDDYSNAATQPSLIHADETKELIYSFTFDKLDENYTDYVTIENNDYKYIGIIIDMGEIGTP